MEDQGAFVGFIACSEWKIKSDETHFPETSIMFSLIRITWCFGKSDIADSSLI